MKNVWSIICENFSIDPKSNLLSIVNCIEEIRLEIDKDKLSKIDKITVPINLQLISLWVVDDFSKINSIKIKIELIDPDGRVLNKISNIIKSNKGEKRIKSVININGIPITKSGRYYFKIFKKDKKYKVVSEIPLDIILIYKKIK